MVGEGAGHRVRAADDVDGHARPAAGDRAVQHHGPGVRER